MQNVIRDQDVAIQGLKEADQWHKQRLDQVDYSAKATSVELFQVKRVCNEMTRQLMWLNMNMRGQGQGPGQPSVAATTGTNRYNTLPGPPRLIETVASPRPASSSHAHHIPIPMFNSKSVNAGRRRAEGDGLKRD